MDELLGRHFISLFLILLFSIRLGSQRSTQDRELRYFWLTVVCCFLLIVEDFVESIASQDPNLRFWRILFSVAGYVLRSGATVGLVLVVSKSERRNWVIWIPFFLNLLVNLTAFFTDLAFGFDANYAFYRGPLGFVSFVVPFFYLAMILWLTFRYYRAYSRRADRVILITCALFCVLSAILDSTRGGVRLNDAIMISNIFFYMFLRSYDIRKDALTRLLNRQSFYEDCDSMNKTISAAAFLDMNGLKTLNDAEGYEAGDNALKIIGEELLSAMNQQTRVYRVGGDEFTMLFLDMDERSVRQTVDRIRERVAKTGYSLACGIAMREENEPPESLVRRAEMKMFEEKARYYQEKKHDRRHHREDRDDFFDGETRKALEDSSQPLAIYQFSNHRIETLLVSDGFCRLFGYPDRAEAIYLLDHEMYKNVHPDDQERFSGAILRASEGQELDIIYRSSAGMKSGYRVIHARGTHEHLANGARVASVWYMDEGIYDEEYEEAGKPITQMLNRALHEESILHATHFDVLTGLPNLTWFFKLYEAGKAKILGEGRQACLLYMDLNGMKQFNQKYGFAEGDKLLKAFAETMVGIFGKQNCCHVTAGRFAAGTTDDEVETQTKRLFEDAQRINEGRTLPVRIGVYSTAIENVPVSSAYDKAKMACDSIRPSDTSSIHYYDLELRNEARKHQYLLDNIDRAIAERWIRVYYQPIVSAADGTLCDEEALARWVDPVEGFLSPAEFVPLLEKAGLIYKLDLCVLDQMLEKIKAREEAGEKPIPQSLNLSRSDFEVCDIVEEIRKRVDAAGVSRKLISIEITESIVGRDFAFMNERIARFHELGFVVWMDDFGSGYSSLDVLRDIPFDLIKFDMSFMRKIDEGEKGRIILTELMRMAHSLRVDTICEGVETEAHVRFLREIGCSKLQGYYYGKPMPWGIQT